MQLPEETITEASVYTVARRTWTGFMSTAGTLKNRTLEIQDLSKLQAPNTGSFER